MRREKQLPFYENGHNANFVLNENNVLQDNGQSIIESTSYGVLHNSIRLVIQF